ncbi:hypothetical protein OROHE_020676 [Orobanche hederae]
MPPNGDIRLFMQSFSNEQSPNGDIRLFMQSFSNEQSPNDCSCSLSRMNSHQMNLTNFYHNAPTRDIRLFMQSFSNE